MLKKILLFLLIIILTFLVNTFFIEKKLAPLEPINIQKDIIFKCDETIIVKPVLSKIKIEKTNPKLVIIIDDVITISQVNKIRNIPYPVTMAFLPPTSRHKDSAKITHNLKNYMIHLPLEASHRKYEEDNTLHIKDNFDTINARIEALKILYPNAKYINNHTGSKFTENEKAMDILFKVLKQHNYIFVDSRTTAKTVTQIYANKYQLKYLSRNVFLDNKKDKKYIQNQLIKAVQIAKRDGSAIAIGHPHNITLKTLSQSKHLLKGLDIVLIDNL